MWIKIDDILLDVSEVAQIKLRRSEEKGYDARHTIVAKFKGSGDVSVIFSAKEEADAEKVFDRIISKMQGVEEISTQ